MFSYRTALWACKGFSDGVPELFVKDQENLAHRHLSSSYGHFALKRGNDKVEEKFEGQNELLS